MAFSGINYLAIGAAAVAAWLFGALYYGLLSKPWMAAQGFSDEERTRLSSGTQRDVTPFILSFVAELIMAWVLAGVIAHLGPVTIRSGIISGAFVWLGFVATTLAVNNAYGMKKPMLSVIDGAHWLGVLIIMGGVVGAFGV